VVKFEDGRSLLVQGALRAVGTNNKTFVLNLSTRRKKSILKYKNSVLVWTTKKEQERKQNKFARLWLTIWKKSRNLLMKLKKRVARRTPRRRVRRESKLIERDKLVKSSIEEMNFVMCVKRPAVRCIYMI